MVLDVVYGAEWVSNAAQPTLNASPSSYAAEEIPQEN
jgi:hypothetical protein